MKDGWQDGPAPRLLLADLRGKTAVVTGASAGIGKATCELLLENGARVFGLAREMAQIRHDRFVALECDLSDVDKVGGAFAKIAAEVSTLDFVVNVAGVDPKHPIDQVSVSEWDNVIDLNLRAYYFVIKYALPLLRPGKGRSVVNVSSINYRLGVPGRAAYAASKAGILGLTTGLSRELGREGIRVNTVSPGWIFTERQIAEYFKGDGARRNLDYLAQHQAVKLRVRPEDIANHIAFYLSDVSRASVGHNCVVDAGWLLE